MACNYQTIAPAKYYYAIAPLIWDMLRYFRANRAHQAILDQLATKSSEIQDWRKKLEARLEARFDKIEHVLASLSSAQATLGSANDSVKIKPDHHQVPELESHAHKPPTTDHKISQSSGNRQSAVDVNPSGSHVTVGTNPSVVVPGTPGAYTYLK